MAAKGYSTQALGSVKSLIDSKKIVVYNRFNLGAEYRNINIYNIDSIYEKVKDPISVSGYVLPVYIYSEIDKVIVDSSHPELSYFPFLYESLRFSNIPNNSYLDRGFNVIIYLNAYSEPLGYTEFTSSQGINNDVQIYISLTSSLEKLETNIEIDFSLQKVKGTKTIPRNTVESSPRNLYNYATVPEIKELVDGISSRNYLSSTTASSQYGKKSILHSPGIFSVIPKESGQSSYVKNGVGINLNINPYLYSGFDTYNLGFFNSMLSFYSFDQDEKRFSIYSISDSSLNMFSSATPLTEITIDGYTSLPSPPSTSISKILYGAGPNLVCKDINGSYMIFDILTGKWRNETYEYGVFINPFDKQARIRRRPTKQLSLPTLMEVYPELANTYYVDFENQSCEFNPDHSYFVERIIGSWIILKESWYYLGQEINYFSISSPNMIIYLREEELDDIKFINDSAVMIRNSYNREDHDYYTLYTASDRHKYYTTEWFNSGERDMVYDINSLKIANVTFPATYVYLMNNVYMTDRSKIAIRKIYYDSGEIKKVDLELPASKGPLNLFRKGLVPVSDEGNYLESLPNIVDCFGGFIFYLNEVGNRLNYL